MEAVLKRNIQELSKYYSVSLGDRTKYVGASDISGCPRKAYLSKKEPTVKEQGGVIYDAHLDATRSWMEVILPQIVTVPTKNNDDVHMMFAVRLSNSDFGDGALDVA